MSFPFDVRFQATLIRQCVEEDAFAQLAAKHFEPHYFDNPAHRWIHQVVKIHHETYGRAPRFVALYEYARSLEPVHSAQVMPTIQQIEAYRGEVDPVFVGDRVVEWVKRNMFVDSFEHAKRLYNENKLDDALEFWLRRGDELRSLGISEVDRGHFAEDYEQRQRARQFTAARSHYNRFPIGVPEIDAMLNGGLPRGQCGVWIGAAKVGKSMTLAWTVFYTLRALRQPVLVFVLEGSRALFEDRLDAAFADTLTSLVERGDLNPASHQNLIDEYRELRGLCVIRGYTKGDTKWEVTTGDIWDEVEHLRKHDGFNPSVIVVDYADLLHPRTGFDKKYEAQDQVYKDQSKMATRNNGYAWWTAAQSQRIERTKTDENFVLLGDHVADSVGKVRHFDFYGSWNRTLAEASQFKGRLFGEAYRYGAGNVLVPINTDFGRGRLVRNILTSTPAPELKPEELAYDA